MMPPPKKRGRAPLILGLLAVLVIAAVGVTLLIVAPWKSDDSDKSQTFALYGGITVQVQVPSGWTANTDSLNSRTVLLIVPNSAPRSMTQLMDDTEAIERSGTGEPVHAILLNPLDCEGPKPAVNTWSKTKSEERSTSKMTGKLLRAQFNVNGQQCPILSSVDVAAGPTIDNTSASDVVARLLADNLITITKVS